jgi:small subunit ribosomal protein S15
MSQVVFQDSKPFQLHGKDTGSADVQIARLSDRINYLTEHLGKHKMDHSTRRGLLRMVARRRKLLDYLKLTAEDRYKGLLTSLKLRR